MKTREVLKPITQESTPSLIAAQLRQLIGQGVLGPGAQLVEMDIAKELGVSRGPVREAMQRLTQEGLLTSVRNKGVFVSELGESDLRDIYEARTAVEKAAAGILLQQDRDGAVEALLESVEQMRQAMFAGDSEAMSEADIDFHERLVSLASSPRLSRMHGTLLTETRMCLNRLEGRYSDEAERVEEHRAIVEALREGKREVMDLLDAHKEDALSRLVPVDKGAHEPVAS